MSELGLADPHAGQPWPVLQPEQDTPSSPTRTGPTDTQIGPVDHVGADPTPPRDEPTKRADVGGRRRLLVFPGNAVNCRRQAQRGRCAVIATLSLDIARPPERVYAVLIDQDAWAALDPPLVDFTPRGPLAVGMTGTMTRKAAGRRITDGWTILELEPGTRFAMKVTGAGYELIETIDARSDSGRDPRDHCGYLPTYVAGRSPAHRGVGAVHPSRPPRAVQAAHSARRRRRFF